MNLNNRWFCLILKYLFLHVEVEADKARRGPKHKKIVNSPNPLLPESLIGFAV